MPGHASDELRVPDDFWARHDTLDALSSRDIGRLFLLVRRYTGASQTRIGAAVGLSQGTVSDIMAGKRRVQSGDVLVRIADGLDMPAETRLTLVLASHARLPAKPDEPPAAPMAVWEDLALSAQHQPGKTDWMLHGIAMDRIRQLRHGVDQAIGDDAMSDASLDDWEQTALRLGADTRYRPMGPLLQELAADFSELQRRLARRQPLSTLRRLTLVTAQMAGLMSLTLLKFGEADEAYKWARTARVAADEAGEPTVRAWVRAQEAYAHFYDGSFATAIYVARQAQTVAQGQPCAGVALSAALEARAHAALGNADQTRRAIERAEITLAELSNDQVVPSAFGYDEAQLRFHEGNAFTHLHDTEAAWNAQQAALRLYPANDYMDRSLTHLDRASCLAYDGDITGALVYATGSVISLTDEQRTGLITLRGQQILSSIAPQYRSLPAGRELQEVLMLTAAQGD